jgi:acyl carrier protein
MGTFIEDFLVKNFARMPLAVRIATYVFILFLYAYLLLVPRFINGELVVENKPGQYIPYRSGELKMIAEGHVFKFKANEEGVWSAPIVSRLPHTVKMSVYVVDADAYLDVEFKWRQLWTRDLFRVIVSENPPAVKVVASLGSRPIASVSLAALLQKIPTIAPNRAWAGNLQLPSNLSSTRIDPAESKRVREKVIQTVAAVTGKDIRRISLDSPLTGASAPTFVQRIEIIQRLEREFQIKIPDEHWNYINTVGELVDYVEKRQLLEKKGGSVAAQPSTPARNIQQRPVFKR